MKKYGFALFEVLIALVIVGVLAAFTIPSLIREVRKNSFVGQFSSAMSSLENGFTTMMIKENINNLFDSEAWRNENATDREKFAGILANHLKISDFYEINDAAALLAYYGAGNGPFKMNANGSKNNTVDNDLAQNMVSADSNVIENGQHCLLLRNGALVFLIINNEVVDTDKIDRIKVAGGALYQEAADVWIDVNGRDMPNTLGRDIFGFYLDDSGKLYPLGGKDAALYDAVNNNSVNNPPYWNGNSYWKCSNGNLNDGYGCAGRIVEENYKMNY